MMSSGCVQCYKGNKWGPVAEGDVKRTRSSFEYVVTEVIPGVLSTLEFS